MTDQIFIMFAQAAAQTEATPPPGGGMMGLLPLVAMGVIFYFLLIRPQQKKQKEHAALLNTLKTGDKVITAGGIHGMISNVKDTTVVVKIAESVKVEIEKGSVTSVIKRSESDTAEAA